MTITERVVHAPSYETLLPVKDVLHRLVVEQREELADVQVPHIADTRKTLFAAFKGSERFRQLYEEAARHYLTPHTEEELEGIRGDLAGRAGQDIAYMFLTNIQPSSRVLLSPERTFRFYRKLHPEASIVPNPFGIDSLKGVSVPDGLIAEERGEGGERIVVVCEYTLSGKNEHIQNKYNGYDIRRRHFPQLFAEASLLFFMPKHGSLPGLFRHVKASYEEMPFTHEQFRDFIDGVLRFYPSNEDVATLVDMQERAREQIKRGACYQREGKITREYRLYMRKFIEANEMAI